MPIFNGIACDQFAVPIDDFVMVEPAREIMVNSLLPSFTLGCILFQGALIPVLDLNRLLEQAEVENRTSPRVIVILQVEPNLRVAVLCSSAHFFQFEVKNPEDAFVEFEGRLIYLLRIRSFLTLDQKVVLTKWIGAMQTFQRISNLHQHEKRRDPVQSLMENPTEPFLIYRVGSALFCAPLAQIFEVRAEADLQKIEINSNLKFIRIRDVLFSWIDLHEKFTESRGDGPSIVLLIQQSRHQLAVAVSAMIGLAELSPSSAIAHRRYREEIHPDLICSVHDTPYGLTAQIDFGKLAVDEAPSLKVILQKMYDPNPS